MKKEKTIKDTIAEINFIPIFCGEDFEYEYKYWLSEAKKECESYSGIKMTETELLQMRINAVKNADAALLSEGTDFETKAISKKYLELLETKLKNLNPKDLKVEILEIINALIPEFISTSDKQYLADLLNINRAAKKIDWRKSYAELVSEVNSWKKKGLIQYPTSTGIKEYILDNFTYKGGEFNKGTLNNAVTNMNR